MQKLLSKVTDWEQWPWNVFYFPLLPFWLWYCIKSRSIWFFSASNPTLTFGGFEGEGKEEMYQQLPPDTYPRTLFIQPDLSPELLLQQVKNAGFSFPLTVKPDVGMKGYLFRKLDTPEDLLSYHQRCPVYYMVQDWVDFPIELGVFYVRFPDQKKGIITGLTQKEPISVVGDGSSTLLQLMEAHPRAQLRLEALAAMHRDKLEWVVPNQSVFNITIAANRTQGAQLHNLHKEIDEALLAIFDRISHHAGYFYFGRYDVKCTSLEDLKAGRNFYILEFNGAGAAPNHIYHCNLTLGQAYKEVLKHWKALYRISRYNHQHGYRYWPFLKGYRFLKNARAHFAFLKKLDTQI